VLGPRYSKVLQTVIPASGSTRRGRRPQRRRRSCPTEPFILFVGALRRVKGVETLFAAYDRLDNHPPLVLMGTFEEDTPPDSGRGDRGRRCGSRRRHGELGSVSVRRHAVPVAGAVRICCPRGNEPRQGRDRNGSRRPPRHDRHGRNGLLVRAGDVNGPRDAIQLLLDDPEMRERLGRAARIKSHDFTAGVVVVVARRLLPRAAQLSSACAVPVVRGRPRLVTKPPCDSGPRHRAGNGGDGASGRVRPARAGRWPRP